jgi:hypothetical protein
MMTNLPSNAEITRFDGTMQGTQRDIEISSILADH